MSQKYESQYDYHDVICPYCKGSTDGSEFEWDDCHLEVECDKCDMVFFAERQCMATYSTEPSCELNGRKCVPKEHITGGFFRCEICRQSFRSQEENQPPS